MMQELLRFYLVRHGITTWNRDMRMQGHTDVPLSPEGIRQAERIGARLFAAPQPPEAVWSSDLGRARATAEAIAAPLGLTVNVTPLLRETMLGEWEGLTREEIVARGDGELFENYTRDYYRFRPPKSEPLDDVWKRMIEAENLIRATQLQGNVVVVGHGSSMRVLICAALDAPFASMRRLWLDNASLSIVEEQQRGDTRLKRLILLNDTSHLSEPFE